MSYRRLKSPDACHASLCRGALRSINGEGEGEESAAALRVLDTDRPAVRLDQRAHNRQSQAAAAGRGVARAIHAIEAVEDALPVLRRDAGAAIGDAHAHEVALDAR